MYCRCLPENLSILGYARSKLSKKDLQEKVKPNLKGDKSKIDEFLDKLDYEAGAYDKPEGFQKVRHGQLALHSLSWHACISKQHINTSYPT